MQTNQNGFGRTYKTGLVYEYQMATQLEDMSLIELKQFAKTKKIKQYYIMKKDQLIELLTMEELPFKFRLEKMTITEMRAIAKQRGMRGFWSLSKEQLCDKLFGSHDEHKDDGKTCKHEDPQNENTEEVRIKIPEDTMEKRTDDMVFEE